MAYRPQFNELSKLLIPLLGDCLVPAGRRRGETLRSITLLVAVAIALWTVPTGAAQEIPWDEVPAPDGQSRDLCPGDQLDGATACANASVQVPSDRLPRTVWTPDPSAVGTTSCPGGTEGAGARIGSGQVAACVDPIDRAGDGGSAVDDDPCRTRGSYHDAGASVEVADREIGTCGYAGYQGGWLGPIPVPPELHVSVLSCGILGAGASIGLPLIGFSACAGLD